MYSIKTKIERRNNELHEFQQQPVVSTNGHYTNRDHKPEGNGHQNGRSISGMENHGFSHEDYEMRNTSKS